MREVMSIYCSPFRFDRGYIWDNMGRMVADYHDIGEFRVRGWGRIQYIARADALHDAMEAMLTDLYRGLASPTGEDIAAAFTERWRAEGL